MLSAANIKYLVLLIVMHASLCSCSSNDSLSALSSTDNTFLTENYANSSQNDTRNKSHLFSTGNNLWDDLIRDCLKKPTFSCIQRNVYSYLDDTLKLRDVNLTSRVIITQNKVDYMKYTKETNSLPHQKDDFENEILNFDGRSGDSPIEEVTNSLYGKGMKFMVTHDYDLKMPEMMFDGATFRISPRSFEGNGLIAKLELVPRTEIESRAAGTPRILFKKIKKFFKNKILLAVVAVVLIIKIIKIKIMWLLPLLVGVGTAKKLVLKFLLFLFPALAQIFKLCGYYHSNYHKTNYHHHKHNINHLHTVQYDHQDHGHGSYGSPAHHITELIHTHPPKGHPSEYIHGSPVPAHLGGHFPQDWELSGPGLGSEYISDINRNYETFKPKLNDDYNEINSWGLGHSAHNALTSSPSHSYNQNPLLFENSRLINPKTKGHIPSPVYGPVNLPSPVYGPAKRVIGTAVSASQFNPQYANPPIDDNLIQAQKQEAFRIQNEQRLVSKQQQILKQQPFASDIESLTPKPIDIFYSPILSKLDRVFTQLGFLEEPCRERLVCSFYKNPARWSPHSNYVSAELSRDSAELQRPTQSNPAVVRFYRYVQAARDGQDQRDCLRVYPQCQILTE